MIHRPHHLLSIWHHCTSEASFRLTFNVMASTYIAQWACSMTPRAVQSLYSGIMQLVHCITDFHQGLYLPPGHLRAARYTQLSLTSDDGSDPATHCHVFTAAGGSVQLVARRRRRPSPSLRYNRTPDGDLVDRRWACSSPRVNQNNLKDERALCYRECLSKSVHSVNPFPFIKH